MSNVKEKAIELLAELFPNRSICVEERVDITPTEKQARIQWSIYVHAVDKSEVEFSSTWRPSLGAALGGVIAQQIEKL